jgi:hypothetical protein
MQWSVTLRLRRCCSLWDIGALMLSTLRRHYSLPLRDAETLRKSRIMHARLRVNRLHCEMSKSLLTPSSWLQEMLEIAKNKGIYRNLILADGNSVSTPTESPFALPMHCPIGFVKRSVSVSCRSESQRIARMCRPRQQPRKSTMSSSASAPSLRVTWTERRSSRYPQSAPRHRPCPVVCCTARVTCVPRTIPQVLKYAKEGGFFVVAVRELYMLDPKSTMQSTLNRLLSTSQPLQRTKWCSDGGAVLRCTSI